MRGSNPWGGCSCVWPCSPLPWSAMPMLTVGTRPRLTPFFIGDVVAIEIVTLSIPMMSDRVQKDTTSNNRNPIPATIRQPGSGSSRGIASKLPRTISIISARRSIRRFVLADTECGGLVSSRRVEPVQSNAIHPAAEKPTTSCCLTGPTMEDRWGVEGCRGVGRRSSHTLSTVNTT